MAIHWFNNKAADGMILSPHLEASLRAATAAFAAFCLSVAAPAAIIPQSLAYVVGLVTSILVTNLPSLIFGVGMAIPAATFVAVFALGATSLLLCAATISDGFMVATYALYALWMSSLKHGTTKKSTASFAAAFISLPGLLSLSFRTLVQDGFSFPVTVDDNDAARRQDLYQYIVNHVPILETACTKQGLEPDCWQNIEDVNLPSEFTFEIPSNVDMVGGQDATLDFSNYPEIQISISGGLWIVAGLWKWQGLNNPLANNRNLLICICWSLVCVAASQLLIPPLRTLRNMLSQMAAPAALQHASQMASKLQTLEEDEEKDKELESKLVHDLNLLDHGQMAVMTAFEPRLLKAPLACSWPKLQKLLHDVSMVSFSTLSLEQMVLQNQRSDHHHKRARRRFFLPTATVNHLRDCINACSEALVSGESTNLLVHKSKESSNTWLGGIVNDMVQSTNVWIVTMRTPTRAALFKDPIQTYLPWLLVPMPFIKRLLVALTIPRCPKLWNFYAFMTTFKYVIGYIILFSMTVYWKEYANYAINVDNLGVTGLYSGWQLTAYSGCWLQTFEGSIKKGVARLFGTALGAFFGWLGIIVASGSYDLDAEINPYGLVTWLTVIFFISTHFFALERGLAARIGKSSNYGNVGQYFSMTMILIALEVNMGKVNRDDITVNRMVANLTGIAMSSIVSLIPPHVRGGDPKHTFEILEIEQKTMQRGLEVLLEAIAKQTDWKTAAELLDEERTRFVQAFTEKRTEAQFLLKDASSMKFLPFLRVHAELAKTLEQVSALGGSVALMLDGANFLCTQQLPEDQNDQEQSEDVTDQFSFVANDTKFREKLQEILSQVKELDKVKHPTEIESAQHADGDPEEVDSSEVNFTKDAFIALLESMSRQISISSQKLSTMK